MTQTLIVNLMTLILTESDIFFLWKYKKLYREI